MRSSGSSWDANTWQDDIYIFHVGMLAPREMIIHTLFYVRMLQRIQNFTIESLISGCDQRWSDLSWPALSANMATDPGSIVKEQPAQVQDLPRTMSLQNGIHGESFF